MKPYLFFPGCTIPARLNQYELSVRRVSKELGIELIDAKDIHCCGFPISGLSKEMALLLSARILSLAEESKLDLCVLCNGCFSFLKKVNKRLKEDKAYLRSINEKLSKLGLQFKGKVEVKHILQILYEDIGIKKIESLITIPLNGVVFAVQYGCHLLYPSDIVLFDHPMFPSSLDKLVNCLKAKSMPYRGKNRCCGSPLLLVNEKMAFSIGNEKISRIMEVKPDGIVTACPFCHIMLEMVQLEREKKAPVLLYPQALGIAFNLDLKSLGIYENKIPIDSILEKIS